MELPNKQTSVYTAKGTSSSEENIGLFVKHGTGSGATIIWLLVLFVNNFFSREFHTENRKLRAVFKENKEATLKLDYTKELSDVYLFRRTKPFSSDNLAMKQVALPFASHTALLNRPRLEYRQMYKPAEQKFDLIKYCELRRKKSGVDLNNSMKRLVVFQKLTTNNEDDDSLLVKLVKTNPKTVLSNLFALVNKVVRNTGFLGNCSWWHTVGTFFFTISYGRTRKRR